MFFCLFVFREGTSMEKQNFEEPRNLKEGVLKNLETEQSLNECIIS